MKNFIFKSTAADLQKMFQLIETIQKNVLYITYRIDMLIKRYDKLEIDKGLQTQVDEYFEDETSPQTDTDKQWVSLPDLLSDKDLELLVNTYTKACANKNELLITLIEKLVSTTVELSEALNMASPEDKLLEAAYR